MISLQDKTVGSYVLPANKLAVNTDTQKNILPLPVSFSFFTTRKQNSQAEQKIFRSDSVEEMSGNIMNRIINRTTNQITLFIQSMQQVAIRKKSAQQLPEASAC
ncbi:MAG: hypothetical protein LUG18_09865 [Candidatus Azobacteroides sp.]|nr:hypothetical protein [Candidatus Azobacteroides sp.]